MSKEDLAQHERLMREALVDAEAALKRNEYPVGCVIVHDGQIVARGGRRNSASDSSPLTELEHAEMVAMYDLSRLSAREINRAKLSLYTTLEPCLMCMSAIIVNRIPVVVYAYEDADGGGSVVGTDAYLNQLNPYYQTLQRPQIIKDVLREASLRLFQQFFQDGNNDYLADSLMRKHTQAEFAKLVS